MVNGQSVPKGVETNGRTDGRTGGGDCITSHANVVGKYVLYFSRCVNARDCKRIYLAIVSLKLNVTQGRQ